MYTISKTFEFCYGHRLLNDDGKCRNLHGHNARAILVFRAEELDERGMVVHFDRLKEAMGKWISENLDHALLLSEKDPLVTTLRTAGESFRTLPFHPTAENIARMIYCAAREFGLPVTYVDVWETETSKATYKD